MKLIIDIPEIEYNTRKIMGYFSDNSKILEAVKNGTPIPDNATNGEVLKTMFMPNRVVRTDDDVVHMEYDFTPEWWNAPYQKNDEIVNGIDYGVPCNDCEGFF